MRRFAGHVEGHVVGRIAWLRAAVLGANDGIVSTASLVLGVAAASASRGEIATAGFAGLVAGAMSMAAGEYVSVSSQSDAEAAELRRERVELKEDPASELAELTSIYVARGLDANLAREVAEQLTSKDALAAHARDELHLSPATAARPILAATTSALTFAAGAAWHCADDAAFLSCAHGQRRFAVVACLPWRDVGAHRQGPRAAGYHARFILGRRGHGVDGSRRKVVRCDRLALPPGSTPRADHSPLKSRIAEITIASVAAVIAGSGSTLKNGEWCEGAVSTSFAGVPPTAK